MKYIALLASLLIPGTPIELVEERDKWPPYENMILALNGVADKA